MRVKSGFGRGSTLVGIAARPVLTARMTTPIFAGAVLSLLVITSAALPANAEKQAGTQAASQPAKPHADKRKDAATHEVKGKAAPQRSAETKHPPAAHSRDAAPRYTANKPKPVQPAP